MGRKGKTQKHSAAEITAKHKAAKEAKGAAGGGNAGAEKRKNAGAKISATCEICMSMQPNIKSMEAHYDSKHPKQFEDKMVFYENIFNDNKTAIKDEPSK